MSAQRNSLPFPTGQSHPEVVPYPQLQISQPYIRITDHDVLSGRGVSIAQHAGNERFRALVCSRHDVNYCHAYTTAEKRAVAEEIVAHIKSLNPPGRFLRRVNKSNRTVRGLDGPWEELSKDEQIRKTCQALRDCNRNDRTGYAASVFVPEDVSFSEQIRSKLGLTNKQFAELAANNKQMTEQENSLLEQSLLNPTPDANSSSLLHKRMRPQDAQDQHYICLSGAASHPNDHEPVALNENITETSNQLIWLKKQRMLGGSDGVGTPIPAGTPATSGSSGGYSSHQDESGTRIRHIQHHHHNITNEYSPIASTTLTSLLAPETHCEEKKLKSLPHETLTAQPNHSREYDYCNDDFSANFDDDIDISNMVHDDMQKRSADPTHNDPLVAFHMSEAINDNPDGHVHGPDQDDGFGPASPLHLHHGEDDPFP